MRFTIAYIKPGPTILSTCPIRAVRSKSDLSELPHFYYKSISLTIYPASALGAVGTITGNQDISCNRDELPQYVFSYSNIASLRKRSSCGFTVIKHLRGHSLPPIFHMQTSSLVLALNERALEVVASAHPALSPSNDDIGLCCS